MGGVDGTIRYLRNVMGLWLLQECVREWGADTAELLAANRGAIERGSHEGPPGIEPLILPTRAFSDREELEIGRDGWSSFREQTDELSFEVPSGGGYGDPLEREAGRFVDGVFRHL